LLYKKYMYLKKNCPLYVITKVHYKK
jgi:hypothetical protein